MRQFITIARNAFMELVRQPVFLLLMTFSAGFSVFLACVPYFGFGDDPKLVKDSVLAVMLLSGLFGAVISASASVAHEIRSGTALAVMAKPVGRAQFLLAKYVGLAGALGVLTYANLLSSLLASRMAFDAYGNTDTLGFWIFAGCLVLAYALGGFTNYFLRRPFVADAVFFVLAMITMGFVLINFIDKEGQLQAFATGVDWRLIPAAILILMALWTLAGVALACSTRLEMVPTLAICSGLFLLGLMSDYMVGRHTQEGPWWMAAIYNVIYTIIPNWQLFWLADALENQKAIPWSYVGQAAGYVVGYLGASLALALLLFEDRELT
jgi:ABC-2 type transport system permease protein